MAIIHYHYHYLRSNSHSR